jgi:hypothetical protein
LDKSLAAAARLNDKEVGCDISKINQLLDQFSLFFFQFLVQFLVNRSMDISRSGVTPSLDIRTISCKKSGPKRGLRGQSTSAVFSLNKSKNGTNATSKSTFNDDVQSLATSESTFDVASEDRGDCRSIDHNQLMTECLLDSNDDLFIVHFYLEDGPISAALDGEIEEIVASGHQITCKCLRIGASRAPSAICNCKAKNSHGQACRCCDEEWMHCGQNFRFYFNVWRGAKSVGLNNRT